MLNVGLVNFIYDLLIKNSDLDDFIVWYGSIFEVLDVIRTIFYLQLYGF